MEMRHRFTAIQSVIDDEAVAGTLQPEMIRDLGGLQQQMAQQTMIIRRGVGNAWDGFSRHDEDVRWRLRIDVVEGQDQVVFIDDGGGDVFVDDLLEYGFAHEPAVGSGSVNVTRQRGSNYWRCARKPGSGAGIRQSDR